MGGCPDMDGYLTKKGAKVKNWKRRWFVLKGDTLYYYKTRTDLEQKGEIQINTSTSCTMEGKKDDGKYYFTIVTPKRKYKMFANSEETVNLWVQLITKLIEGNTT